MIKRQFFSDLLWVSEKREKFLYIYSPIGENYQDLIGITNALISLESNTFEHIATESFWDSALKYRHMI